MNLTAEQLNEIENLAELQFSPQEVAIILQVDENEFDNAVNVLGEIRLRYQRGRLRASAEVRKAILTQAKNGSSPAQKQMLDLIAAGATQQPARPSSKGKKPGYFGE